MSIESKHTTPASRVRLTTLALCLILLLGLAARGLRTTAGLPYVTHWDEPQIANASLRMMKTGDLNPHFFNYGSLLIYLNLAVDVVHYFTLVGRPPDEAGSLASLDDLEVGQGSDFPWYVSHPSFYVWNRFLTALFGTASVLLAFFLARDLRDVRSGLFAALFLATLGFHVENSAYVKTDVPASFFVLLGVWLSVSYLRHERPAWLMAAAGSIGLAASIKYNMATGALVPLAALAMARISRSPGYRPWLWPLVLLLPPVLFLLGTPFALLDLRTFLDHAGFEVRHYLVAGHDGFGVEPGLPHLRLDLAELVARAGALAFGLALIGLLVSTRRKLGLLVFALPLLQMGLTARTSVAFHRNLLVVYPFLAIGFGIGLSWALSRGHRMLEGVRAGWRKPAAVMAWSVLALTAGHIAFDTLSESWRLGRSAETRSQAVSLANRLVEESPGRWNTILIASELRLHPSDRDRLAVPFEVRPTIELLCQREPRPDTLLMVGAHYRARRAEAQAQADRINERLAVSGEALLSPVRGAPLWLDRYSRRPGVELKQPVTCTVEASRVALK